MPDYGPPASMPFDANMAQPFRPLLPATENSMSRESPNSSSGPRQPKRTPIKAACEACRKRKSKCSAERPRCSICVERNTPCEYKTLPTETHLTAQKRRMNSLQLKSDTYDALCDILRTRQEDVAIKILQRIRTGTDVETVVKSIQDGDLLLQVSHRPEYRLKFEFPYKQEMPAYLRSSALPNPYLRSALYEKVCAPAALADVGFASLQSSGESYRMYMTPYHAVELLDARLIAIDVAKWTAVPASNALLRSLIEICESGLDFHPINQVLTSTTDCVFEYPFHSYFHKDLFLDDMLNGRDRFCSPLLVNAVLAAAWHGYFAAQTRAEYWRPDNLGYRFLAEAHRLWARERESPSITTLQAACIMNLTETINGVDKLGWPLLHTAIEMAQELGLFSPLPDSDPLWGRAATITTWGIFNWQALHCYHSFRLPLLQNPPPHPLPDPDKDPGFYGEIHVRYPESQGQVEIRNGHVFKAVSEFRVILNTVGSETYGSEAKRLPLKRAFAIRQELRSWYENLPDCLTAKKIALPSHLKLHMHLHVLVVSIFEPHEQHVSFLLESDSPNPSQIVAQGKVCLETLVRLSYLRHGFESYDPVLILYIQLLAWSSLGDYRQLIGNGNSMQIDAVRSTFVLCAKAMWDQGRNCFLAETIYRLFRNSLPSQEEVRLLREVADVDDEQSRTAQMIQEVRSDIPVGIFSTAKSSLDTSRLGRYISWCEQMVDVQSQRLTSVASDEPESPDAGWARYQ